MEFFAVRSDIISSVYYNMYATNRTGPLTLLSPAPRQTFAIFPMFLLNYEDISRRGILNELYEYDVKAI